MQGGFEKVLKEWKGCFTAGAIKDLNMNEAVSLIELCKEKKRRKISNQKS